MLYKIGENYPDLFSDHPSSDKRIKAVYEHISQKYPKYVDMGFNTKAYTQAIAEMKR